SQPFPSTELESSCQYQSPPNPCSAGPSSPISPMHTPPPYNIHCVNHGCLDHGYGSESAFYFFQKNARMTLLSLITSSPINRLFASSTIVYFYYRKVPSPGGTSKARSPLKIENSVNSHQNFKRLPPIPAAFPSTSRPAAFFAPAFPSFLPLRPSHLPVLQSPSVATLK